MQSIEEPKLIGITKEDIQAVLTQTLRNFKESKTRVIYIDASYLYNFDLGDFPYIKKLNMLMRRTPLHVREWHKLLERWCNDQTVRSGNGNIIKPLQIERTFDRVVNEGMEALAACIVGSSTGGEDVSGNISFPFRAIGEGVSVTALPSDTGLADEIDRIDVTQALEGGSISRDGSTVYSVGNHAKSIPTSSVTECGIYSGDGEDTEDLMLDHSVFQTPISHIQDADIIGSTTVIYMCSA